MTLDKARELIAVRLQFAGGYERYAARLIRELDLESVFGLKPGTDFSGVGR